MTWITKEWMTGGGDTPGNNAGYIRKKNFKGFYWPGTKVISYNFDSKIGTKSSTPLIQHFSELLSSIEELELQGKVSLEIRCDMSMQHRIFRDYYPVDIRVRSTVEDDLLLFRLACT